MRFPKFFEEHHDYRLAAVFIAGFLALYVLFNFAAWTLGWDHVSVFAAGEVVDKYVVRSELLKDATNYIGVSDAESAARTWAQGVKGRSGALQYAVMTRTLKAAYATDLESTFPNWVTGGSSPWVDSFQVTMREGKDNTYTARVQLDLVTSTGPYETLVVTLTIVQEDGFWRVAKVAADPKLLPYTGFTK